MSAYVGYFDQFNQGVAADMEGVIGVPFHGIRLNASLNTDTAPKNNVGVYLNQEIDRLVAKGVTPIIPYWNMNLDPGITFADVRAKTTAAVNVIQARGTLIQNNNRFTHAKPLLVSFHHEQYVNVPGAQEGGGLPADYPGAFRSFVEIFQAMGLLYADGGKCRMCFVPTAEQFGPLSLMNDNAKPWAVDVIAPDPTLYEFGGTDIYSKDNYKRPDASDLNYVSDWFRPLGKQYVVGEIGATTYASSVNANKYPTQQADWVKSATDIIKSHGSGAGGCYMLAWTLKGADPVSDLRFDGTPATMARLEEEMKDPFFQPWVVVVTDDVVVTTRNVTVKATATDPDGVASVEININSGGWQPMTKTAVANEWSLAITLNGTAGTLVHNQIQVRATDAHPSAPQTSPAITYKIGVNLPNATPNAGAPSVTINATTPTTSRSQTITINATDPDGIASVEVSVNGGARQLAAPTGASGTWSLPVSLNGTAGVSTTNTIQVFVKDAHPTNPLTASPTRTIIVNVPATGNAGPPTISIGSIG